MSNRMSRRELLKVSAATGAALVAGSVRPAQSQQKVIKWKGQTRFASTVAPYGPFRQGETGVYSCLKQLTDWIYKRTDGRLMIEWAEPGAIFPPVEGDRATAQGVVQIACGYGGDYVGRIPETDIETGGVFFWEDESQVYECLHKYGLFKAIQKAYDKHNLFWLPLHVDALVGVGTIFPAPNPEVFKGRKIRTVGVWGDYISVLGGTPVAIPWGDVYMGLKLGTVDGWMAGSGTLEELKLKEVAKGFVIHPKIGTAVSNITINKAAYGALPKDIQDILRNEAPHASYFCSTNWHNQNMWVARNAKDKYGIKIYYWSPEDIDRVTKLVVDNIFPKIAKKSPECTEMMEIVKKQMKDYGRL